MPGRAVPSVATVDPGVRRGPRHCRPSAWGVGTSVLMNVGGPSVVSICEVGAGCRNDDLDTSEVAFVDDAGKQQGQAPAIEGAT